MVFGLLAAGLLRGPARVRVREEELGEDCGVLERLAVLAQAVLFEAQRAQAEQVLAVEEGCVGETHHAFALPGGPPQQFFGAFGFEEVVEYDFINFGFFFVEFGLEIDAFHDGLHADEFVCFAVVRAGLHDYVFGFLNVGHEQAHVRGADFDVYFLELGEEVLFVEGVDLLVERESDQVQVVRELLGELCVLEELRDALDHLLARRARKAERRLGPVRLFGPRRFCGGAALLGLAVEVFEADGPDAVQHEELVAHLRQTDELGDERGLVVYDGHV